MSRQILSDIIKEFSPTVEEIAEALKLHPYTICRLCREGEIPAFKVGGQWRFDIMEIERWRKKQKSSVKTQ